MRRRIAISLASLAGLLLIAGSAGAWETRVLTLGGQNRFIEDDANIWLYPQKAVRYSERLYLDLARKEGGVIDSDGESEGLDAIKSLNGGFFLEMSEKFHMAFWASEYTDTTTHTFLTGSQAAQRDDLPNCRKIVEEEGLAGNNNCRMASQEIVGDDYRDYRDHRGEPIMAGFAKGANRKLDIFAGWQIAKAFALGGHLWFGNGSWAYYKESTISPDRNLDKSGGSQVHDLLFDTNTFGLGVGATIGLFPGSDLDVGMRFSHYSYTLDDKGVYKPTVDGGTTFSLDSRMSTRLSKDWWLVPSLQFNYLGFSGLVDVNSSPGDSSGLGNKTSGISWTSINFDLGLGMHMRVIGKAQLFTAVGLDYDYDEFFADSDWGASRKIAYTTLQLPYWRTGFEAPLFDWLDFRAGFVKRWGTWQKVDDYLDPGNTTAARNKDAYRRRGSEITDVTYSLDDSEGLVAARAAGAPVPLDFETFVGTTMHYAGWNFTTELDPNFLFHGPFNTQTGGDRPWFARFEISYRF